MVSDKGKPHEHVVKVMLEVPVEQLGGNVEKTTEEGVVFFRQSRPISIEVVLENLSSNVKETKKNLLLKVGKKKTNK